MSYTPSGYLSSKSLTITSEAVERTLMKFPSLNLEWLFTGKGEMEIANDSVVLNDSELQNEVKKLKDEVTELLRENRQLSKQIRELE